MIPAFLIASAMFWRLADTQAADHPTFFFADPIRLLGNAPEAVDLPVAGPAG